MSELTCRMVGVRRESPLEKAKDSYRKKQREVNYPDT